MKKTYRYDGQIIKNVSGGVTAVILKKEPGRPNFDIVKENEKLRNARDASMWIEEELDQWESGNGAVNSDER